MFKHIKTICLVSAATFVISGAIFANPTANPTSNNKFTKLASGKVESWPPICSSCGAGKQCKDTPRCPANFCCKK